MSALTGITTLLCLAGLTGCAYLPGHAHRPFRSQVDCAKVSELLTPTGRLAALISVHAHALGGADQVHVLGLDDAVTVVECDALGGKPLAISHKRRVVAELAAYGQLKQFADQIQVFGTDLSTIYTAVRERYPNIYEYLLRNPAQLELAIANLIADQPSLGGLPVSPESPTTDCAHDWKVEVPFLTWSSAGTIILDGQVSVPLPPATVEQNVDAQRWDECSEFWDPPFDATMIVDDLGAGNFKKRINAPPPGGDYTALLFEHFACDAPGCAAFFNNLLDMDNAHGSIPNQPSSVTGYAVGYDLHNKALDGCVGSAQPACPLPATHVLTDYDDGWLGVFSQKGRTMVVTHKEVHFDNIVVNAILMALWTNAEVARELAEVACCLKASGP